MTSETGPSAPAVSGTSAPPVGDQGLFGPGSVTWRIMGEPVMWIAGLRALYLQALQPRVMQGTWQNTSLADRSQAWGRFTRTTEFVRVRTFGSTEGVERAGRRLVARLAVGEDQRVLPIRVLEKVIDPELLHEATDEIEIRLAVLHAIVARRIAAAQLQFEI